MPDYSSFLPAQRLRPELSMTPDGGMVAYLSDASGQFNIWIHQNDGAPARQLTRFTSRSVRQVAFSPDGTQLAFTADAQGDEQAQVYVIPVSGGEPERLSSDVSRKHRLAESSSFDPSGRYVLCAGNDRDPAVWDLLIYDLSGGLTRRIEGIAGRTVYPVGFSPDGTRVLAGSFGANTDIQCHVADLTDQQPALELVPAHLAGSFCQPACWDSSGTGFYVLTTEADGDHAALAHVALHDGTLTIIDAPSWDIEQVAASADGSTLVWTVNEDGRSVLHGRGPGGHLNLPALPEGVAAALQVASDGTRASAILNTPARPPEVAVIDLNGPALVPARVRYLTDTRPSALAHVPPVIPEHCGYPAFDGTEIPALIYRPPGTGPFPVLIYLHGGPEGQGRPAYNPLFQCLLASGIAVMAPNVRGSSGYGLAWQQRIYRDWGGVDLEDFHAAARYLHTTTWADPKRLAVMGASYGGFAALSCLSRLPDLWAAGVSCYGPANLETLARSMPPDWATTVATMIGDPDKDADQFRERSPVTHARQITAPLLVIQGAHDPRVPQAEADQIVAAARANGAEVSYLVFHDEGHGFTNRDNDIKAHTTIVEFLVRHLTVVT
jgi:dipeptidyl aminopeptidase/acylaminoacyl peptidase